MDWEEHKFGTGVKVTFAPRAEHSGRAVMPELAQHAGRMLHVRPLWLMGEADPYPGEWALGHADGKSDLLGLDWIASGDVREPNVELSR